VTSRQRVRALLGPVVAVLLAGCGRACSGAPPNPRLYVTDEDGGYVVVVDPQTSRIVTRIAVGKRPRGAKVSPDGKFLYVALSGSPRGGPGIDESKLPPADRAADGVGIVDLRTEQLVRTLESGADPESFDVSADGAALYVSNEDTAEMTAIDLRTGTVRGKASVGREPEGVTVHPAGKVVFVTSEADSEVTVVDTASLAVVAHIPTAARPRSVVFTRDGATGFVTCEMAAKVTVIDALAYKPLDDVPIHLDSPQPMGPRPMGAALSPDGKVLYVTSGRGGSIAVVDVASRAQVRSFEDVGARPWGIILSADGSHAYTANGSSMDVSVVDLANGRVDGRVKVGGLPWGVALGH
jgi:YVTN family beta-propeller protein